MTKKKKQVKERKERQEELNAITEPIVPNDVKFHKGHVSTSASIALDQLNQPPPSVELLCDQEDETAEIRITLTDKVLHAEYEKLNIHPNCIINLGSHVLYITADTDPSEVKLQRQFTGIVWLFKNRHAEESLGYCCSIKAVRKFFALKYGMSLFEYYKHPDKVASSLKNNEVIALLDAQCKQEQFQHISELLRSTTHEKIELYTNEFGVVKLPSDQEIDDYLHIAKIVGSGFSRQCELYFSESHASSSIVSQARACLAALR